ncbi:MAG: F0F1 ATP synthase subunit A [Bacteroidetes bacterium]|nr:F0F1 ATP synthase subunit A [Bacteroidota bacterium]MCZ6901023.1 F0F1 ATP synthase subunit A [Bacteroidota bacterium]
MPNFHDYRPLVSLSRAFLLIFLTVGGSIFSAQASEDSEDEIFNPADLIMHHIIDSHEWHLFSAGDIHVTIPLPVILYSSENGLVFFLSNKITHGDIYKGYRYEHNHIVAEDGHSFFDFSITKNVTALFVSVLILLWIFTSVAKGYKKNEGKAPSGVQSFFEPIIIYVRDEIVKPSIGKNYEKYLPYMLTLFFFIWFGNFLGLLPGAANLTGNIAVTLTLAFFTFIMTLASSNKHYWIHIFNPPGAPWWLKFPIPILPMVEFIGIFNKPFSLLLRLFVAITAGHIVILSLISLTFIFQSYMVGFASTLIVTFINLIELLVATIQAYVFTLFSSMYIGMAQVENH